MNVHERLWMAINHEEADRIPTFTQTIEPEFIERFDAEIEITGDFELDRVDLEVAAELGYDSKWVHYGGVLNPESKDKPLMNLPEKFKDVPPLNISQGGQYSKINSNGEKWYVDGVLKNPEILKDWISYLKQSTTKDEAYFQSFKDLWDDSIAKGIVPIPTCGGPVYESWSAIGMDRFAYMMRKYPVLFKELIMTHTKVTAEAHKCYYELGIDMMMICDDHAFKGQSMFNPKQTEEFILPAYKLLADTAHKYGAKFIVHTDGDYTEEMPFMVQAGVDAVEPLEYEAGMRLKYLKENWGKELCFIGNVPASDALCVGTVDYTIQITKECIRNAGEGGGLIIGQGANLLGCSIVKNVQAMLSTVKKFGIYPLDFSSF